MDPNFDVPHDLDKRGRNGHNPLDLRTFRLNPGRIDPERKACGSDHAQIVGVERPDQLDLGLGGRLLHRERRAVGKGTIRPLLAVRATKFGVESQHRAKFERNSGKLAQEASTRTRRSRRHSEAATSTPLVRRCWSQSSPNGPTRLDLGPLEGE